MENSIFVFRVMGNILMHPSDPNQGRYVDPRLTVVTAWQVTRVYNTADDRQTVAARQAPTKT